MSWSRRSWRIRSSPRWRRSCGQAGGAILKPLAWQGVLCHGPRQGNKVTFARPDTVIREWKGILDSEEAAPHAIAAYLGAYGPAASEAFNAWLIRGALKLTVLRRWIADMGDELTEVDVEGETLSQGPRGRGGTCLQDERAQP
jgi:Winged helix DNA-binding domain